MRILVFGKSGQVARELARLPGTLCIGRDVADLTRPDECAKQIAELDIDAVINAAAYTAVDASENDAATAEVVNGVAPGVMAAAAAQKNVPFVHISTDYVFSGDGIAPWTADAPTAPLGVYGSTKLSGEAAVIKAGGASAILRTSWVFSAHGNNFVKTMLRLAQTRDSLNVVGDQIGGPTSAASIARCCVALVEALASGGLPEKAYHLSGTPDTSWAGFARSIFEVAGQDVAVNDISTAEYPTPAKRPANSRMDCSTLERDIGFKRPDWVEDVKSVVKELEEQS